MKKNSNKISGCICEQYHLIMKHAIYLFTIFFWHFSFSQEQPSFQYTVIDISNGLNTNNVNDCIRDQRGFLWIATDFGITRYAYQNSIHFSQDPVSGKPLGTRTKFLLRDSILYVCGRPGFYKINTNTLKFERINIYADENIDEMIFYKDLILLASLEGNLFFYNIANGGIKKVKLTDGLPINMVVKNGDLFFLSLEDGMYQYDLREKKITGLTKIKNFKFTDRLYLSDDNQIYLTNYGYFKKFDTQTSKFTDMKGVPENLTSYLEPRKKSKFYITNFQYLFLQNGTQMPQQLYPPVDQHTEYKKLKIAENGDMYAITNQGLIIIRPFKPFKKLNVFGSDKMEVRRAIFEDTVRKKMFFFSYDKLSILDQKTQKTIVRDFPTVAHVALQRGDSLLVATEGSNIISIHLGTLGYKKVLIKEQKPLQFISFAQKQDGEFLLGTLNGLYKTKDFHKGASHVSLKYGTNDFSHMQVKAIYVRSDHEIWLGGSFGILVLNERFDVIRHYSSSEKGKYFIANDEVNCFYAIEKGIYAGLDGELIFVPFDNGPIRHFYSDLFGKSTNRIVSILEDQYHDIWFSSYHGVYRLNTKTFGIRSFHAPYYFSNDEFNRSSSCVTSDGKLYFGNIAEHIMIDPDDYRENLSTPFFQFNTIRILGNNSNLNIDYDLKHNDIIELPSEGSSVDLSFSYNDPVNIEKINYQYRLPDLGQEWIDLQSRPSLQLFSLPSGEHNIEIRAVGFDGNISQILNLKFLVPAFFYKTIWFNLLIIILVIAIVLVIYWIRVNNLNRMLNFRKELSSDLHDTVGTSVTKTIYAAQAMLNESSHADSRLKQIIEDGRKIHMNFRDVLWSLEGNKDEIFNLFDRINEIGNSLVENTRFDFILIKDNVDKNYPVTNRQKREILLITREAINNAMKHSSGNSIVFEFKIEEKRLVLTISDNGKNNTEELSFTGMGLSNIYSRVKKIGGDVIFSKRKNGFRIRLAF